MNLGPDRERTPLTRKEKATWIRTIVAEARRDDVGHRCQQRLVELMDMLARKGGLCDHETCRAEFNSEMDTVQAYLWLRD